MAEKKTVVARLKMNIMGGGASPAPPVGSSLGQYGVNMMDFINAFNSETSDKKGQLLPVKIDIYEDKSFSYTVKSTAMATLIREKINLKKGSGEPNKTKVGKLTDAQLTEIAEVKMVDLNANDVDAAKKIVAGTARSMGIEVVK